MPKYRHKMRLQNYLRRKGSIDPLTRHLILSGCDNETVVGIADQVLHGVLGHATKEQSALFSERIHRAEELFKRGTAEYPVPLSDCLPKEADREIHWWLFRMPKRGTCSTG